jgi:hypothetical protein
MSRTGDFVTDVKTQKSRRQISSSESKREFCLSENGKHCDVRVLKTRTSLFRSNAKDAVAASMTFAPPSLLAAFEKHF